MSFISKIIYCSSVSKVNQSNSPNILFTVNAPHKVNGKELDVKKALPKDGGERGGRGGGGGGGRNDSWGGNAGGKSLTLIFF